MKNGKIIRKKRSKPTSYEAAKSLVTVTEEVTAQVLIDRLIDLGRREIPTKRSLSANFAQGQLLQFGHIVASIRGF